MCVFSVTSAVSDFATLWTVAQLQFLCPWDSPGKNSGVGCHFFLQGIFPSLGSNLHLLHWQADSFTTETSGKPIRNWIGSSNWLFRFLCSIAKYLIMISILYNLGYNLKVEMIWLYSQITWSLQAFVWKDDEEHLIMLRNNFPLTANSIFPFGCLEPGRRL